MQEKEFDLFMNVLRNKDASFNTFVAGGLNVNNTQLLPSSEYEHSDKVQEALKDQYGQFDKNLFDKLYNVASTYYNLLSQSDYDKTMSKQISYHRDDIFAPKDQRRTGPDYQNVIVSNPYKYTFGISEIGKIGDRTKSVDELAQSHKVLLNPTKAGDNLENANWGNSPNDGFLDYFFDTLVLAQYDKDGEHQDPISGETVEHKKGDLKLDDTGNFYYERLDGRDVYGKRVLNKMNVLTTDRSFLNYYDPFDSDDIKQKSIGGSIVKNVALVGSMFIPYVGPWIAGISIATQLAGLTATLGKMLSNSDNSTLSEIEGWSKSLSRQGAQTEYAQENAWCWENMINLIGDVFGQLKEQRFIFEKIPYALSGTNIYSESSKAAKLAKLKQKQQKLFESEVKNLSQLGKTKEEAMLSINELNTISTLNAQSELDSFIKGYQKIGEIMSKGYMTAITVGDTYGEAKLAGASDLDATLLTLGYAAGEYALLNTGIGEWILPELRAGKYKSRAIAKALANINKDTQSLYRQFGSTLKNIPKEGKKQYAKKIFNIGKNIAKAEYVNGSKTLKASLAAGIGEGIEEVSEEILADFSKGCYDVVKWLQNDDTRLDSFGYNFETGKFDFKNLFDRYSLSLIGGFVGGGLTNITTNYHTINNIGNMTPKQALQELIYMDRNGEIDKFLKEVDKMELGDKNLSMDFEKNEDGTISFLPATENNNQDTFIKSAIHQQVKIIKDILSSNGAEISDQSFLNKQTLNDLRLTSLHNSAMAGTLLNEFNSLSSNIVKLVSQINTIQNKALDTNSDNTVSDSEKRHNELNNQDKALVNKLETQLKEKQKELKDLLDGKKSYDFIADALFEMTTALSNNLTTVTFPLYAEQMFKKKFNTLTNKEKEFAYNEYTQWKKSEGVERIKDISTIFRNIAYKTSELIEKSEKEYLKSYPELIQINQLVSKLYQNNASNESSWLQTTQDLVDISLDRFNMGLSSILGNEEDARELQEIAQEHDNVDPNLSDDEKTKIRKDIQEKYQKKLESILIKNISSYINSFLERGYINTETRQQLNSLLTSAINIGIKSSAQWYDENQDKYDLINPYIAHIQNLQNFQKQIDELPNTPIENSLNEFSISIGNDPVNVVDLQNKLNQILNESSSDITKFNLDDDVYNELENAINTVKMYRAAILAARTDQARIGDLFGYNAVLNEVAQKTKDSQNKKLAEINSEVADIFVSDIDTTLNKLLFLKTLYNINRGQKLSKQNRVSIKTDLLIYKRLKHLVQIPDDQLNKWEGFLELQNAINQMILHEELLSNNSVNLSEENQEDFEKEMLLAQDAIYDFFQIESNKAKLNDYKQLAQLINPNNLQLYTEANELLNEDLDNLDDSSIIWWMASRAAVKASDFYHLYNQLIDPNAQKPIAPISTQELAIYNNYANIINGNVFSNFYKAYRYSMMEDWKNKTVDERKKIAKLININERLTSDEWTEYTLNFLTVPRFQNIVLTEGIPGSGKSSVVFSTVIELVKNTNKDLLSNVMIMHGANGDSAIALRDNMGLTENNSKTFDRQKGMKEINAEWKEYQFDPISKKYVVPKTDYMITDEKEIQSSLGVKETQTPYSLIIIDEISKFSVYDLDQIDKYAKKYGITVLVAGDFDQSGIIGTHPIEINGERLKWDISLSRTNFIRNPKLGVSIRTNNSIKTANLQKLQAFMQQPTNERISFQYYEDESGLYGDKVILYSSYISRNNNDVVTSIDNSEKEYIVQSILQEVDKLIETLQPNQKIGYIYSDENSPIFKELSSDKYKQYIDLKQGGAAQGLEGQYYIIEADFDNDSKNYLRDLYTGISRAQQGSIIIAPVGDDKKIFNLASDKINNKVDESLSDLTISKFASARKNLLDRLVPNGNSINYTPRDKQLVTIQSTPTSSDGLQPGIDSTPPSYDEIKNQLLTDIQNANSIDELNNIINNAAQLYPQINSDQDVINLKNQIEQKLTSDPNNQPQDDQGNPPPNSPDSQNPLETQNNEGNQQGSGSLNTSPEPVVDPLIYEDNISPITSTDIIDDQTYQTAVDNSNQGNNIPQSIVDDNQESIAIEMLLHTFNTFETGVLVGPNGELVPVGGQEWMDARIDSINGLVKIDQHFGNQIKTVEEYVDQIGRLRSILFNTGEKSEICTKLEELLGLDGAYVTFALKSSPRPGDNNRLNGREFVDSNPSPFSKGISEKTIFNGSSDVKSHQWHPKSIIAIIGSKETGDILELPLIALSSPFTLLQTKDNNENNVFDQVFNRFQVLQKNGITYHEISKTLIEEFDGNIKYQNLVNLFKLFNFTDGGVFYIRDNTWTPFKNLELLGPQFVIHRGYYQGLPGYNYDKDSKPEKEWMTLQEFAIDRHNPQMYVTQNVMVSMSGLVDGPDRSIQIAHAGHPFVLISYDTDLNNDKKVIDYYIQQQSDPSVPKKVKLAYVIPPKATFREYFENNNKILNQETGVQNIGNLFTSYKLLKILVNNDSFKQELERKIPGIFQKVYDLIQEVDSLDTIREKKDKLYEPQDWASEGFSAKPIKLAGLFDGILNSFIYNKNSFRSLIGLPIISEIDETALQLVETILSQEGIDGVYYNVKIPKRNPTQIGPFHVSTQGYMINGKPFKIHGKIDSYTFRGNMGKFVEYALSRFVNIKDGHIQSKDSFAYRERKSNLNNNQPSIPREKINIINYLKHKAGVDFTDLYQQNDINTANLITVNTLNSENNNLVAFIIGDKIKISNRSDYLSGNISILSNNYTSDPSNAHESPDLSKHELDNNGNYNFILQTQLNEQILYDATYDSTNDILYITPKVENKNSNNELHVTQENINVYLSEGKTMLEDMFIYEPELKDAFEKTTYDEFIDTLNKLAYVDGRINDYEGIETDIIELLNNNQLSSKERDRLNFQLEIIRDLIDLDKSHDPYKQDINDETQICPPTYKISF